MPKKENKNAKTFYEEFKDSRMGDQRFLTPAFIDDICLKLMAFALEGDGAESIELFVAKQGIPIGTWHNWIGKYPRIKEAHEEAKQIIGQQRLTNGMRRNLDAGLVKFTLFNYLPEFKKTQEWLEKTKDQIESENKTVIVVMSDFERNNYEEAKKKDPVLTAEKWKQEH